MTSKRRPMILAAPGVFPTVIPASFRRVKARRSSWKPHDQREVGRETGRGYHSDKVFPLSNLTRSRTHTATLRALADRVLEAPDIEGLAFVLTRTLPESLRAAGATLLVWNRKLDSFEALTPGETHTAAVRPEDGPVPAPEAHYLLSDGQLIETPGGSGHGVLLPLMARSGLVGMLVLGPRRQLRNPPYGAAETRGLWLLARRAALALENTLYQRELIETERMAALGTMAGMLAHDFRGPMTIIRGYAETIVDGAPTSAEIKERAEVIVKAVDRLERMTTETLDFARGGGGQVVRRSVVLPQALDDIARDVAQELPGLTVVREFELGETAARLDVDKLRRAIENIGANARDAMKGAGVLRFGARLRDGTLILDLTDEGPGVPPAIRETVFDPFVTQGKKGGTGLGLAVARRFVQDHGGSIELLPDGPGARFRIRLPLG